MWSRYVVTKRNRCHCIDTRRISYTSTFTLTDDIRGYRRYELAFRWPINSLADVKQLISYWKDLLRNPDMYFRYTFITSLFNKIHTLYNWTEPIPIMIILLYFKFTKQLKDDQVFLKKFLFIYKVNKRCSQRDYGLLFIYRNISTYNIFICVSSGSLAWFLHEVSPIYWYSLSRGENMII